MPATVIVAQNSTSSTGIDGMVTDANLTETVTEDLLNVTVPEAPGEPPEENATLLEENTTELEANVTIPQDNETNITVPEENITLPEDDETAVNETNVTLPEENVTIPEDNVTIPDENATLPEENVTIPDENVTVPDENVTEPEINVTEPEDNETETNVTEEPSAPEITLVIENPERVTRDSEDVTMRAVVTNAGGTAYNLTLEWMLPEGFAIVEGTPTEHIGVLDNSETFTSDIIVFPVIETPLGPAEIRARVSYE